MTEKINKKISNSNILVAILFFFLGAVLVRYLPVENKSYDNSADLALFWEVWGIMEEKYPLAEPSEKEKIYSAIEGLVESYGDDYSKFLPPEESEYFNQSVTGTFAGIGAEIAIRNGLLTIIAPLKDSPAENGGLLSGDIITHVDDFDITGETLDGAISRIRGPKGSIVTLKVYRQGEDKEKNIEITRDTVVIPVLETEIINDVFVVYLYNFNEQAEAEFAKAMQEFKDTGLSKIILDVRNNPGGFLVASIDIASYFLPQGTIILKEYFGEGREDIIYRSSGHQLLQDINPQIIILQNNGSASASEIIAGALVDNGVAKIAGEQSYGKGSVQQLIELPELTALKVTIAKWLRPNGDIISEIGITPDHEIMPDYDSTEDIQLQETLMLFN